MTQKELRAIARQCIADYIKDGKGDLNTVVQAIAVLHAPERENE